ncbi:hypothetical protein BHE74_00040468 [Ensete ventricosum]|nr:hypothetical protein BHE74_00040468 [Ensete ventricosum]RZR86726.1 hypothetical protein BHM03_00013966 [Ensete ventricosum]
MQVERYFWFYRTTDATRVEIAAIHLEGDTIQWFNWYEHTHEAGDSRRSKGTTTVHSYGEDEDSEPSEESLKSEGETTEEEPQPVDYTVHVLADYSNPQTMKVGGLLK